MTSMIPAAAYLRVSTGMQVEAGTSLPSQLAEIKRYAKANGYQIVMEFTDAGDSAKSADRPEFQRMIRYAKSGSCPFKSIIAWKSSRFARNREDAIIYKGLLRRHDIELRFVAEPVSDNSPISRLLEGIIECVDEFYSLNLAEEVLRGTKESVAQGYAPGGTPPYGYRKLQVMHPEGAEKQKYSPDPDTAQVVKQIYSMYAGGSAMNAIAESLNERGIKTARGRSWASAQIHNVLFRFQYLYMGNTVYNKYSRETRNGPKQKKAESDWVIADRTHEPIITREMAAAVNKVRQNRPAELNINGKRDAAQVRLLSGLLQCGECGRAMGIATNRHNGIRRLYYRCPQRSTASIRLERPECSNLWLRCEPTEELISTAIIDRVTGRHFIAELRGAIAGSRQAKEGSIQTTVRGIQQDIDVLEKRRNNIIDAIADGTLDHGVVRDRLNQISVSLDALRGELVDVSVADVLSEDHELEYVLENMPKGWVKDQNAVRLLLVTIVDRIEVFVSGEVEVFYKAPIDSDRIQVR